MIQIFYGDEGHRARCMALAAATPRAILKVSPTTNTWPYVTDGGAKDTDEMWPGVLKVEQDPLFQTTKNFVMAGAAVKARDNLRKYTIDFGTIGAQRNTLIVFFGLA